MKVLSLKIPDDLASELTARAERQGTSKSAILRDALTDYLTHAPPAKGGSFLSLAGSLVGCLEGPGGLSYDKRHLEDYGR
jgi:metal-responsive CopG/Arc/MetJ family transcriptional regulator